MNELPVDRLGPYPLLQLAAAIAVLAALGFALYRGTRDRTNSGSGSSPQIPAEQRWFFDGPLSVAVNLLRDCRNHLGRLVEITDSIPEEQRRHTKLLEEIKNEIEKLPSRRQRR